MSIKHAASSTAYSKLPPPFPVRSTGVFRVDAATGAVKCYEQDVDSSSSDDETHHGHLASAVNDTPAGSARSYSTGEALYATEPCGEAQLHHLGIAFTPTAFLRPKVMSTGVKCAPAAVSYASFVGFHDAGCMVLFGGTGESSMAPTNETWVYRIKQKRWYFINPLEVVSDALAAARKERGCLSDRIPPARCGHAAVAMRDVPDPTRLNPETLTEEPVAATMIGNNDNASRFTSAASLTFGEPLEDTVTSSPSFSRGRTESRSTLSTSFNRPSKHDGSLWTYQPCMLVFGGCDLSRGTYFNDLWLYDLEVAAWRELKPIGQPPKARWHHTAAVLEQRMFIFGGESCDFDVLDDVHLYDHLSGAWRRLRTVEPVPPRRMMHAACVVGDKMIVVGGVGSQSSNASLLDAAVGESPVSTTLAGSLASFRRRSSRATSTENDATVGDETSVSADRRHSSTAPARTAAAASYREELSDVWILNLRTMLWREAGRSSKRFSPFVVRDDSKSSSAGHVAVAGSATGPKLSMATRSGSRATGLQIKSLEGHTATAVDDRVLVVGGRLNGKNNRRLFAFHLPTETWAYLGELPANAFSASCSGGSGEDGRDAVGYPVVRFGHAVCSMVLRMSTHSMKTSVTLDQIDAAKRQLSDEADAIPLLQKLVAMQAAQVSFSGVLSVYHTRPILSHTVCCYLFGGANGSKHLSDLWRIDLRDITATRQFDELFGSPLTRLLNGQQAPPGKTSSSTGDALLASMDSAKDLEDDELETIEAYLLGGTAVAAAKHRLEHASMTRAISSGCRTASSPLQTRRMSKALSEATDEGVASSVRKSALRKA